jgi:hypothetical protein
MGLLWNSYGDSKGMIEGLLWWNCYGEFYWDYLEFYWDLVGLYWDSKGDFDNFFSGIVRDFYGLLMGILWFTRIWEQWGDSMDNLCRTIIVKLQLDQIMVINFIMGYIYIYLCIYMYIITYLYIYANISYQGEHAHTHTQFICLKVWPIPISSPMFSRAPFPAASPKELLAWPTTGGIGSCSSPHARSTWKPQMRRLAMRWYSAMRPVKLRNHSWPMWIRFVCSTFSKLILHTCVYRCLCDLIPAPFIVGSSSRIQPYKNIVENTSEIPSSCGPTYQFSQYLYYNT